MYAKGMTTSDIEAHIQDIYGVEVSDTTVKYRLQGTTQGRYLTGGVPPVRFSM